MPQWELSCLDLSSWVTARAVGLVSAGKHRGSSGCKRQLSCGTRTPAQSWLWDMAASRGIPEKLHYPQVPVVAEQKGVLPVTELGLLVLCGAAL